MSYINFQPNPKIPPIGFFDPISADPKDMMTDVEFLLGVLKKLNEVIAQTNSNTAFINNYSGKIEEIDAEINALKDEMDAFKVEVNNEITARFNQIVLELNAAIATTLAQARAYTDTRADLLENQIREIEIGNITVYDPTTGILSPIQTAIDNIYNSARENALTASEYDALELTATAYDAYELTAMQYDQYGKTLLV